MTNTPINLNKFRKAKKWTEKSARAEENRVKFGRTKADRELQKAKTLIADKNLDCHKTDNSSDAL